jgi:hypothetical protein
MTNDHDDTVILSDDEKENILQGEDDTDRLETDDSDSED